MLYLITSVDQSNNLVNGFALDPASLPDADLTLTHTYSEAGVYRAFVDGLPRMGTVEGNVNNGDQAFRLETLVNVGTAELASPLAGAAPVVLCGIDEVCSFPIDAFDRSGDGLRFRMSTDFEAGTLGTFLQPGPPHSTFPATISPDGVYEWDTTLASLAPGRTFYSTQVTIESLMPPITGTIPPPVTGPIDITDTIASKVALDFLIELVAASGTPPDFEPGPIGTVTETTVGRNVNLVVSATDVDDGQTLTMNVHGLPRGAEVMLKSGSIEAQLRWKPDPDQVGDHLITFVVNDSGGRQRFGSLAITVEAMEPGGGGPPGPGGGGPPGPGGGGPPGPGGGGPPGPGGGGPPGP